MCRGQLGYRSIKLKTGALDRGMEDIIPLRADMRTIMIHMGM